MLRYDIKLKIEKKDKYEITSQGFLMADAWLTRSGIFDYYDDHGKLFREFRPENEVFSEDSLKSLKLIPVTYNHPQGIITTDNVKQYQIGYTGENVKRDGDFIACKVVVTDKNIINEILEKHKNFDDLELSCGYDCTILNTGGEYNGVKYDAIQTNIKYNHLSIVNRGRAGHNVKIKLDTTGGKKMNVIKFIRKAIKLDSFSMDATTGEYPEEAKGIVDMLVSKLDEAIGVIEAQSLRLTDDTKKSNELQGKFDQIIEENKKLKFDLIELNNPESEKIKNIISARVKLEETAKKIKVDSIGKSNKEVMEAVIKAVAPTFDATGKTEEYITARYDMVVDTIIENEKSNNNSAIGVIIKAAAGNSAPVDPRAELKKKCDEAFNK